MSETKIQKQMRCLLTLKLLQAPPLCKHMPLLFAAIRAIPINLLLHMHWMLPLVLAVRTSVQKQDPARMSGLFYLHTDMLCLPAGTVHSFQGPFTLFVVHKACVERGVGSGVDDATVSVPAFYTIC